MMITSISFILILIFLFLSGIHIYWACGGRWGLDGALPVMEDYTKVLTPGPLATIMVAVGLVGMAFVVFLSGSRAEQFDGFSMKWVKDYGIWIIACLFLIRALGDFKYVGFFKKVKQTKFGVNDTKYFSPLCLVVSILSFLLGYFK